MHAELLTERSPMHAVAQSIRGGLETGAGYVGALRRPARETGGTFAVGAFHGRILGP